MPCVLIFLCKGLNHIFPLKFLQNCKDICETKIIIKKKI